MKLLRLLRHAESSWSKPDFDRPLTQQGQDDAPEMAQRLSLSDNPPTLILSSLALRAMTTAKIIAQGNDIAKLVGHEAIYTANVAVLISIIQDTDDQVNSLMLVGHNPYLTYLTNELSGSDINTMPPCGITTIEFACDTWQAVSANMGQLVDFDYPKKA